MLKDTNFHQAEVICLLHYILHCCLEFIWYLQVSLGWGHALAMTRSGKLFGWGYYADGRIGKIGKELEISPLESNSSEFKSVEAAEQSVLEAMEKEKDMPTIWNPGLVEELEGLKVEDVACGLDHSLVVCSKSGFHLSVGICKHDAHNFLLKRVWISEFQVMALSLVVEAMHMGS